MAIAKRYRIVRDALGEPILDKVGKPKRRVIGYTVVAVVPNPAGGRGTRHTVGTFRLKDDADNAERKAKDQIQAGTFQPRATEPPEPVAVLTVAGLVDSWFEGHKTKVQPNTANQYESVIRLHLLPALGALPVADLTRATIKQQLRTWEAAGLGAQLQSQALTMLKSALADAVDDEVIPLNVAVGIDRPSTKKKIKIPRWKPQQLAAFLAEAEHDQLFPFWYFTVLEGMRRGEALGLRWSDLEWPEDETGATAEITQTLIPDLDNGGKARIQQRAKTDESERKILFSAPTVAALKRHRDRQAFQRQKFADVWGDHDLIVTTEIGDAVNPSMVKTNRVRLMAKAGVPPTTTHGLRHLAITTMLSAGTSPALVSSKVGHKSSAFTTDRYGHIKGEDQGPANAALEAFLARATDKPTGTER